MGIEKKYIIGCLMIILLFSTKVFAAGGLRNNPEFHNITLSMSGGYSAFLSNYEGTEVQGSAGATLGFGYEYNFRAFWLSLGFEGQLLNSNLSILGDRSITNTLLDTELDEVTYKYDIYSWYDQQMAGYVNFPIMLGASFNGFYIGAGAKVGMSFYGSAASSIKYETSATYDRFIEDFENMPDHFYDVYGNSSSRNTISFLPKLSAIGEIGYEVWNVPSSESLKTPITLKIGLYVEYGLNTIFTNENTDITYTISEVDPSQIYLNPYYTSVPTTTSSGNIDILPLYVGLKATFMFQLPVPQKCHCLQTDRGASWRNNASKEVRRINRKQRKNNN